MAHSDEMNMESIHGIVPPVTTPFDSEGRVDIAAFRADLRYLIDTARVQGLAVCGSTGEGHTLTTDEIRQITGTAAEEAAGRVPVITGIIADSTHAATERGRTTEHGSSAEAGAELGSEEEEFLSSQEPPSDRSLASVEFVSEHSLLCLARTGSSQH